MNSPTPNILDPLVFLLILSISFSASSARDPPKMFPQCVSCNSSSTAPDTKMFLQCLSSNSSSSSIPISQVLYSPTINNSSYQTLLESTAQNLLFLTPTTPKPKFIITPELDSHVQTTVICCRKHGYQIKTRSGGHDYEGLSFTSDEAYFIILDLVKMKAITIDSVTNSAWVQAGATNGELIFQLDNKTSSLGFPTGTYPTVGVGGLISGGGMGVLLRKYGLAADNILDARIVNAEGKILNRKTMGEDLFWAIRGGGGASFGVILSWKIELHHIPALVTMFTITKTLEQGASKLFYRWQYIAHVLPNDLTIRATIQNPLGNVTVNRTIQISFSAFYLGRAEQLLQIMTAQFPELGVRREDCMELTFAEAHVQIANYPEVATVRALAKIGPDPKTYVKSKSDFLNEPMSEAALEGLWKIYLKQMDTIMLVDGFGGRMSEISESAIPFPHRKSVLYSIMYFVRWVEAEDTDMQLRWSRSLYSYMAPYASKSPRSTYLNNRDLDIGRNDFGRKTTYSQARVWGEKCFKGNFKRLALVKGKVDPTNFFWNEQSVPPLCQRR